MLWQTALVVPESYEDVTCPDSPIDTLHKDEARPLRFEVLSGVSTSASRGVPRASFSVRDAHGDMARATIFGNPTTWAATLERGGVYTFLSTATRFGDGWSITCRDQIEDCYVGRIRPTYVMRRSGVDATVLRQLVQRGVAAEIDVAVEFLRTQLESIAPLPKFLDAIACPGWTLRDLVRTVHEPSSIGYALHAKTAYLRLAALLGHHRLDESQASSGDAPRVILSTLGSRIDRQAHPPTDDQRRALDDVARSLVSGRRLRCLISGDVGTGKTYTASIAIGAFLDASPAHRALVMAPTAVLTAQFKREFDARCPDISTALVTGESDAHDAHRSRVVFGTSAVLSRSIGAFDLVVVDEQHRWSRAQRERYITNSNHLIELSATCIPRTQALVRYGKMTVSELRQTPYPKTIHTRLWEGSDGVKRLFRGIRQVVDQGRPVLVVYPKREVTGRATATMSDRHSIEAAIPRWEAMFPGKVRAITSDSLDVDVKRAISDLEEGRARILLSTLVVEVGLDIKGLRNIVIVHPDRYGLSTLHQLRGRVARRGGDGYCELLLPQRASEKSRKRIEAIVSTSDGFALATLDLSQRGTGDLSADSRAQFGADRTVLYGVPMTIERLDEMQPVYRMLRGDEHA